jgi:hypothetical protein
MPHYHLSYENVALHIAARKDIEEVVRLSLKKPNVNNQP